MASFDDDADAGGNSQDEFENEDEEMEDADQDQDQDQDQGQDDEDGGDDEDEDQDDNDDEDEDDEPESPSRRASHIQRPSSTDRPPNVVLTSPSPRRSPNAAIPVTWIPSPRPESLTAQAYDIVPTMAAPQSTSINAIATTPDMRWVFSGGSDGYVRMYNWVETANGKVPLTVAQKHPFVDSVMKAGSLLTYWENEEALLRTPPSQPDEGKWTSPVYSLAVQHQAIWLLSGLESGGINLQTCRHQAGTRITTLKEHTSAVSVLNLSQDETGLLSGSWDKVIQDWDLNTGRVRRSFRGSGQQISALEMRPLSDVPVPEVTETVHEPLGTFSSNNADRPFANGILSNGVGRDANGEEDAIGSPSGSLFGENDHGSLFGEDTGGGVGGGNAFSDAEDELSRALENEMGDAAQTVDAVGDLEPPPQILEEDAEMGGVGDGGPVLAREPSASALADTAETGTEEAALPALDGTSDEQLLNGQPETSQPPTSPPHQDPLDHDSTVDTMMNGTTSQPPPSSHPQTPPATTSSATDTDRQSSKAPADQASNVNSVSASDLPPQSESTFMSASIDGVLRIWDKRIQNPIATVTPYGGTPPWCTGACWSPDGNWFYAGRRNNAVDEYSIHKLGGNSSGVGAGKPERTFRFQQGSGNVYAVRAMPNGRHLVCASHDILRIYDLQASVANERRSTVPFTIIPGHRGGVISAIHVDPSCRFMLSAAGNRGWESGAGTEVLLGYEIGLQDPAGVWHK